MPWPRFHLFSSLYYISLSWLDWMCEARERKRTSREDRERSVSFIRRCLNWFGRQLFARLISAVGVYIQNLIALATRADADVTNLRASTRLRNVRRELAAQSPWGFLIDSISPAVTFRNSRKLFPSTANLQSRLEFVFGEEQNGNQICKFMQPPSIYINSALSLAHSWHRATFSERGSFTYRGVRESF